MGRSTIGKNGVIPLLHLAGEELYVVKGEGMFPGTLHLHFKVMGMCASRSVN